jgi:hypothetical protein
MRRCSLVLILLGLLAGCGGGVHSSPVSGTVTLDGQPLANALVSFQPISKELNAGPGSSGQTNDRGEYTLKLTSGGSGAVEGLHKVMIRSGDPKVHIPAWYNLKSELKFEVKPGDNRADFALETKKKK